MIWINENAPTDDSSDWEKRKRSFEAAGCCYTVFGAVKGQEKLREAIAWEDTSGGLQKPR